MPDAFISYSRKNIAFARLLMQAFEKNDIHAWIDWQDIPPSADWLAEVYEAIEGSDAFIFIISEHSVVSDICSLEIAHAVENNKRLIPIVVNEVAPSQVPSPLSALQWIFFNQEDQFSAAIQDLIEAIQTDQDWVKAHTRLQNRALDWSRKERTTASLLRGQNLSWAESWLAQAAGKDPEPTALQTEFIFTSRNAADRRQRLGVIGAIVGILAAIGLGVWAWTQRTQAVQTTHARATTEAEAVLESHTRATAQADAVNEERARATAQAVLDAQFQAASARSLASQASAFRGDQLDLGLLLGVEAFRMQENQETRRNLWEALTDQNHLARFLFRKSGMFAQPHGFDPQNNLVMYRNTEQDILILEKETGTLLQQIPSPHEIASMRYFEIRASQPGLRFSPDGSLMLTGGVDSSWILWDATTYKTIGVPLTDHPKWSTILSFSPTFDRLAVLEKDGLSIWDREREQLLLELETLSGNLHGMPIFTYESDAFILPMDGPRIQIYEIASGEQILQIEPEEDAGAIQFLAVNPQGNRLVVICARRILLYDLPDGDLLADSHRDQETKYRWFFDQQGQAYLLYDFTHTSLYMERHDFEALALERLDGEPEIISRFEHFEYPLFTRFHFWIDPDTLEITTLRKTLGGDLEIVAYDPLHPFSILEPVRFEHTFGSWTRAVFHPSKEDILATWRRGDHATPSQLTVWDLSNGTPVSLQRIDTRHIWALSFHPTGEQIAFNRGENSISLWNWEQNEETSLVEDLEGRVVELSFSADGHFLAARLDSEEEPVMILDVATGERFAPLGRDDSETSEVIDIAFHPQETWLAIAYGDRAQLWDIEEQAILAEITLEETQQIFELLAFHPNGSVLATGGEDGLARWDLNTFEPISIPKEANSTSYSISHLAYDPTGTWLVSGGHYTLRLYDADTGQEIGEANPRGRNTLAIQDVLSFMTSLSFNATGTRLSAYAHGDELFFWRLDTATWLEAACRIANRNLTLEEWKTYMGDQPYRETCP
jgi:WD40 repeat protein